MAYGSLVTLGMCAAGLIASTQPDPEAHTATPTGPSPTAARKPGPFDDRVLNAAQTFQQFARVSDQARWAPTLCRAPSPGGVLQSESPDDSTHGKKLYFLFAKDSANYQASAYAERDAGAPPKPPYTAATGQILVKQSFHPEPVPKSKEPARLTSEPGQREYPAEYATDHGKFFRTGEPGPLFIMLKLDPATPETDEGWVYASTSADGKTIIDAGRIASCMECHTQTTRDRLYGPPWSWPHDPKTREELLPTKKNAERVKQLQADKDATPNPGEPPPK